nr:response regulator transcription factor [Pseudoclavibacter chungangensis]
MRRAGDTTIRVLVVDDQPLERTGNALILDSADGIDVIGEAGDGEAAIALVDRDRPDVVLMDVRMPGMNGIDATRIITTRHPDVRVIVLTTFDLDEHAFGSLEAGASAFLVKSATPEALVDAVRTVAAGEAVVAPRLTSRLIAHYLDSSGRSERAPRPTHSTPAPTDVLTPRERDVLVGVVRGLNNAEIGAELHLANATVKSHINSIFAKLHVRDRVHAVILGYEWGLGPRP